MSNIATKRTRNSASFADVVVFIFSFALFIFGFYLFGVGFYAAPGTEFWIYWAGLLAACFSFLVPMIYHWVRDR